MRKLRVLCIAPYEGMYNLMNNIAAHRRDVELIVHMGNLEDGLKAVLENRNDNIDAVFSRGGTAEAISTHCGDIPVYDIIPSAYDVLRTIRLAQSLSDKLAVVGFPSITRSANTLRDIMQYDFPVRTIHSTAECEQTLLALREEGVQVIAGDMISVDCAQKLGMHGLLIVTGLESVETAIDNAVQMYRHYEAISRRAALFSDLLNAVKYDVIIYTSDGQEYFSTAKDLPDDVVQMLREKVSEVIAQGSLTIKRRRNAAVLSIRGRLLQSGGEDYCVWSLSRASGAAVFDKHMIHSVNADDDMPDAKPMGYYLGSSEEIAAIHAVCDRYAAMDAPVLILGERGTGKDRFAHYIYAHSRLKHSSFVIADAALLDDKSWAFLLNSDNSPLTDTGLSIYFRRMNAAAPLHQQQLLIFLKNSRSSQANRLFFSYTAEQGAEPQDELYLYLKETMHCLQFRAPALSQRPEDIPILAGLYINTINVQYGTRVIGLTHDAMLALQNHDWPRNVDQLFQTVKDLVLGAKTSYISEEQVRAALAREKPKVPSLQDASIDLERPLDEIVHDIVLQVYKAENMNQTHTAKRLGISRSTLWRMLK